jgi:hypothetical protein
LKYNPDVSKIAYYLKYWGPAFLMMAAIFAFSSIPSVELPNFGLLDYLVKKGAHALGYGLLALSYLWGLKREKSKIEPRLFIFAWILATLYSASDEFHQSFVPGRHPAVMDVLIDSLGAAFALFLVRRFYGQK